MTGGPSKVRGKETRTRASAPPSTARLTIKAAVVSGPMDSVARCGARGGYVYPRRAKNSGIAVCCGAGLWAGRGGQRGAAGRSLMFAAERCDGCALSAASGTRVSHAGFLSYRSDRVWHNNLKVSQV